METMPYQPSGDAASHVGSSEPAARVTTITTTDWQRQLPVLHGAGVTLRELELSDAPSLLALLTTEEVARFISPPPTTLEGMQRFIAWTKTKRAAGVYACFAVVPDGMDTAVGIFQVRALGDDFSTAEWGFALGSAFWGQGLFATGAHEVLAFAFDTVGIERLEARSCVENGRGNGALRKMGAEREATLRGSFTKGGRTYDQNLWTILADAWRGTESAGGKGRVVVH